MKKLIATLFSLFVFIGAQAAYSNNDVPNEFQVTEHWISLTTSFDIETKTHKLGTLYRKFFSFLLTYEFFDPFDNKMATARSKFFSFTAHFDIYDRDERFLGFAEEKIFTFFPTFDIYGSDASTKLARAAMNFWGTTFTIYDPVTDQEMAKMHRSFFRLKNDWNITITNRALFERKNIDFRVLMTVLAFQGDRENWEKDQDNNSNKIRTSAADATSVVTDDELNGFKEKIAAAGKHAGLDHVQKPDQQTLEHIAIELESNYKNVHTRNEVEQTSQERLSSFIDYCLNLIEANDMPDTKKKAILFLLKMRLEGSV
ncbi:hypothetical protein [Legionella maioricensis]|uniref:Uncharacterized protein n=1 Tax=Legionella maioricensis TaxID=2896528 RepID=A0A9X2CYY5_9GAMM|nr:hypothetical protein [Legionella maioricensis]MCL9683025.1 hypothetical protein [Legionella maioricensis]MCL9686373.1 hypothetical protein [Legionella maioricensis]